MTIPTTDAEAMEAVIEGLRAKRDTHTEGSMPYIMHDAYVDLALVVALSSPKYPSGALGASLR